MAFEFGQYNEFSDSVTISSPTIMAIAKAIELGHFVGQFFQGMIAPQASIRTKAFKVFSRSQTSRDGVIGDGAAGGWDNNDVTGLKMTAAVLKGLTVGHVLQVADEVVIIKAVDRSANTIDVWARGAGSTTPAAHADQVAYKVIGFAGDDTDLKNVESMNETTNAYENYVQTIFEVIDWTKHGELVRQGMAAENATILLFREAEIRVARNLSRMAIWGVKQAPVVGGTRSMSSGLLQQLNDANSGNRNVFKYNAAGVLTETKLRAALKQVFDAGGSPDAIWVSPTVKGYINLFNMANASLVIGTNPDNKTAGMHINAIDYEGAILAVRVDADIPNDKLAIVKQASCKKAWLEGDGLTQKDEPTQSSREMRKSLQGSLGFLIEDVGTDHTFVYGITGGPAERETKVSITNASLPISGTLNLESGEVS
jgi:hypothetical protein